jgi:hypothetical protein
LPERERRVAAHLRFQAEACATLGSPLYAGLLGRAADDVLARGPSWDVLRDDPLDPYASALGLRLMGAVHRLVLRDEAPALAASYGGGGADAEAAWAAFHAVLESRSEVLRELVRLPVQTNEVGRCAALLPALAAFAEEAGLPLRLLEPGASAGLNLNWDRYRYRACGHDGPGSSAGFAWGPADSPVRIDFELRDGVEGRLDALSRVEIASREGCDASPVDPATADGRLTLLAYVWPDQEDRVRRLRGALEVAASAPCRVEREDAAGWVERRLAEPAADRATLVFHSIVGQYLGERGLASFERHVREAGARASRSAPLGWLRMEPAGERAEVRLATWPGGEDRLIARAGYHGTPVALCGDR